MDELTIRTQLTLREARFQEIRMELGHVLCNVCIHMRHEGGSRRLRPAPIQGGMGRRAPRLAMAGQSS